MIINLDEIEDNDRGEFTLLPDGIYSLMVDKGEERPTKSGTGTLAKIQFVVTDGAYEKRRIFAQFNVTNQNKIAQNIGRAEIKRLCAACGRSFGEIDFPSDLVGLTCKGEVTTEIGKGEYKDKNIITKFYGTHEETPTSYDKPKAIPSNFTDDEIPF